ALAKIVAFVKKTIGKLFGGKEETPEQKKKRLDDGVRAGVAAVTRLQGRAVTAVLIRPVLAVVRIRYKMTSLEAVEQNGKWAVKGVVNPSITAPTPVPATAATSIYVDEATSTLKPMYQGKMIRDTFYKKKYRTGPSATVLAAAAAPSGTPMPARLVPPPGSPPKVVALYFCMNTGPKGPNHLPVLTKGEGTFDHNDQPVVGHWNGTGNNTTQGNRNNWYDDAAKLEFQCVSCNLSKKQGPSNAVYLPQVGASFLGPRDKR
ncbi:MAG: hypothetical protein ABI779_23080, partial [Acidobacteriota bacterium]